MLWLALPNLNQTSCQPPLRLHGPQPSGTHTNPAAGGAGEEVETGTGLLLQPKTPKLLGKAGEGNGDTPFFLVSAEPRCANRS